MEKRVVITGADGLLGKLCVKHFSSLGGCQVVPLNRQMMDLEKDSKIRKTLNDCGDFDVIINCAAMTAVDACEDDEKKADQINGYAVGMMGDFAAEQGAQVIHISTDYVFDGEKDGPYAEDDEPNPVSVYGSSKLTGEEELFSAFPDHLVIRVSWLYGPGKPGFPAWVIGQALKNDEVNIVSDKWGSPTYAPDLVDALEAFVFWYEPEGGILHFSNSGSCSWQEWAQACIDEAIKAKLPIKANKIGEQKMADLAKIANWKAKRPVNSAFSTDKYQTLTGNTPREWQDALSEYVSEHLAPELK